jgi:hypothetical protein
LICELNNTLGDPSLTIPFLVAGDKLLAFQFTFALGEGDIALESDEVSLTTH